MSKKQAHTIYRALTSFVEGFPAKTSPSRGSKRVSPREQEADCGPNSRASSMNVRRKLLSSKTSLVEKPSGCPRCGAICTCSDTERVPSHYLPKTLERPTFDGVFSLLPTPTASNYGSNRGGGAGRIGKIRYSLGKMALLGKLANHPRGQLSPAYVAWLMGFPIGWLE